MKLELRDISNVNISIKNILGRNLYSEDCYVQNTYKELDLNNFSNGVYLLEFTINETRFVRQLIIEK